MLAEPDIDQFDIRTYGDLTKLGNIAEYLTEDITYYRTHRQHTTEASGIYYNEEQIRSMYGYVINFLIFARAGLDSNEGKLPRTAGIGELVRITQTYKFLYEVTPDFKAEEPEDIERTIDRHIVNMIRIKNGQLVGLEDISELEELWQRINRVTLSKAGQLMGH